MIEKLGLIIVVLSPFEMRIITDYPVTLYRLYRNGPFRFESLVDEKLRKGECQGLLTTGARVKDGLKEPYSVSIWW